MKTINTLNTEIKEKGYARIEEWNSTYIENKLKSGYSQNDIIFDAITNFSDDFELKMYYDLLKEENNVLVINFDKKTNLHYLTVVNRKNWKISTPDYNSLTHLAAELEEEQKEYKKDFYNNFDFSKDKLADLDEVEKVLEGKSVSYLVEIEKYAVKSFLTYLKIFQSDYDKKLSIKEKAKKTTIVFEISLNNEEK